MDPTNPLRHSWTQSPSVPRGPSGAIRAAEWTLDRLREIGVHIPAGNRLQMAKRLLVDVNAERVILSPDDDRLLRAVAEAQRSIEEMLIIARASGGRSGAIGNLRRQKLELMLSGAELEEDDRNTLARNTQFELYVAAILTMGGASVVLGEPDLRMLFINSEHVGVAAKRLSSENQLERRIREGIKQIQQSKMRGFIALNLDIFAKTLAISENPDERGPQYHARIAKLHRLRESLEWPPEVLGVMNFATVSEWEIGGDRLGLGMHRFHQAWWYADTDEERSKGEIFFARLSRLIQERTEEL